MNPPSLFVGVYMFCLLAPGLLRLSAQTNAPAATAPSAASVAEAKAPPPAAKYQLMDYGPFVSATIVAPVPGVNPANKGIAIKVGAKSEGTMLFDTDLLRWAAGWTGGFLNLTGVVFDGKHGPNPTAQGEIGFCTAVGPGWGFGDARGEFVDPRERPFGPLPATWARYRGLYLHGERVIVSYTVGDTTVLESPGVEILGDGAVIFTRTLQLGKSSAPRSLLVADVTATTQPETARAIEGGARAEVTLPAAVETKTITGLIGAPPGTKLETQASGRIVLRLPALPHGATFTLAVAKMPSAEQGKFDAWLAAQTSPAELEPLLAGGPARWTEPITTKGELGTTESPYVVDTITAPEENPYNSWLRFGGFDFFRDGQRAAITTWSGDVWLVSGLDEKLEQITWKRFATGLHQPLGLRIVDDQVFVLGRDQITRLHDFNGDGEADFYENFNNDVIVSPSFHEFALDLQTDSKGNFYFAKGGAVRPGGRGWQVVTKHTGTILRVAADGSKLDVFATGVRAPNGLGMSPDDELTVADNEGTWTPACRISFVKEGDFLGVVDLSHRATPPDNYGNPILWLNYADVDNSSGGQAWVPDDRWGPFRGEMVHTSYGKSSLFLVMREQVDGLHQGGVVRFPLSFATGIMRPRFNPVDGQLYVCGLKAWQTNAARSGAFQRVRYTGKPVEMPSLLHVKSNGLEIGFTTPLDKTAAEDLQNYAVEQWTLKWSEAYGSPEFSVANPTEKGRDPVEVKSVRLLDDGKTVFIEIPGLKPVMQMKVQFALKSAAGTPLDFEIYNTIAKVPGSATVPVASK